MNDLPHSILPAEELTSNASLPYLFFISILLVSLELELNP